MFMGKIKGTVGRSLESLRVIPGICFTPREAEKEQALCRLAPGRACFKERSERYLIYICEPLHCFFKKRGRAV